MTDTMKKIETCELCGNEFRKICEPHKKKEQELDLEMTLELAIKLDLCDEFGFTLDLSECK